MDVHESTSKLFNVLNKLTSKGYLRTTNLSNELLETLKIIKDCTTCKDSLDGYCFNEFHESSINEIGNLLAESEKEEQEKEDIIDKLNKRLIKIDDELNRKILCEDCKGKKIEELTYKFGNEEIARLLYNSKLNENKYDR